MQIHVIPDWPNFALQLLNTAIMLYMVKRFAWKPLNQLIEKRKALATSSMDEAERMKSEARGYSEEAETTLDNARREAREILSNYQSIAQNTHDDIVAEAKEQARIKLTRAGEEIKLAQRHAQSQIYDKVVELAMESAEKLIKKEIDPQSHKLLFNEFLAEVGEHIE